MPEITDSHTDRATQLVRAAHDWRGIAAQVAYDGGILYAWTTDEHGDARATLLDLAHLPDLGQAQGDFLRVVATLPKDHVTAPVLEALITLARAHAETEQAYVLPSVQRMLAEDRRPA